MEKERKYLSDVMTKRDMFCLNTGDEIKLIVAGTGAGKSQFIIGEFINRIVQPDISKKVLLLANRSTLVAQHKADIKELVKDELTFTDEHLEDSLVKKFRDMYGNSNITVKTYHSFADMNEGSLYKYDTIICDEAHFIIQDGTFNEKCDVVFNKILDLQEDGKKIIMITATEFELLPSLWVRGISFENGNLEIFDYNKEINWYDRIDLEFTSKKANDLLKLVPDNEKCIYFSKMSKNKIKKFAESLGNAEYIYSRWNKGVKDLEMEAKQNLLIQNKTFNNKYLVANSAIDNGVSIKDDKLTTMILDNIYDMVQIIQMIGRKRFNPDNPNDRLKVYVITNHSQVKKEYDKVLDELRLYNDFVDTCKSIKENPQNKDYHLNEFNKKHSKMWEDTKAIHVIWKDTSGVVARFRVRECFLAKIGFKKEMLLKLNEISFDTNEYYSLPYEMIKLRKNINYQFAKQLTDRYDKSINDVVIDKGKMLKTVEQKKEIQKRWETELIPYLETFINKPLISDTEEHKDFLKYLYERFDIGDYRGQAKVGTVNKAIKEVGMNIKTDRKQVNGVRKSYWIVERL